MAPHPPHPPLWWPPSPPSQKCKQQHFAHRGPQHNIIHLDAVCRSTSTTVILTEWLIKTGRKDWIQAGNEKLRRDPRLLTNTSCSWRTQAIDYLTQVPLHMYIATTVHGSNGRCHKQCSHLHLYHVIKQSQLPCTMCMQSQCNHVCLDLMNAANIGVLPNDCLNQYFFVNCDKWDSCKQLHHQQETRHKKKHLL